MSAEVEQLIAEFERSSLRELHVRGEGFELYLSRDADAGGLDRAYVGEAVTSTHAGKSAPAAALVRAEPADLPDGAVLVRAPYLGTFYRAAKPGGAPFVQVGDPVTLDTEVCLVEVMKLFTTVRAGADGVVHAVFASDGAMVAADQPLFAILPG